MVPPDDIRHRMLRWKHEGANVGGTRFARSESKLWREPRAVRDKFMGRNGSTKKLGAAMSLREHRTENEYDKAPRNRPGPYMPVVMTACEEGGYAYEYHHGAIGHGVFTYALAKEFRKARQAGVSFNELRIRVNTVMKNLRYDQTSNVEGPRKICAGPVLAALRKW